MARRAETMPHALTLTSSHDTKRSEDARARIMALSHEPDLWEPLLALVPGDCPLPWRWYLAQSAFAAAPAGDLSDRLAAHAEKAMREAKADTFWTAPDADFEGRVIAAARAVAAAMEPLPAFLSGAAERAERIALAQAALKLTVPGVPDVYQGTEVGSFLLTDPDNRRRPDFGALAAALDDPSGLPPFDRAKLSLTRTLLALRREMADVFAQGAYRAEPAPDGALAFARAHEGLGVRVTVSTRGEALEGTGDVWPPEGMGAQPVRVERI
jgi:(1->4)-alpha-D-glucan 1-alpha-D-glucosylmutase